MQTQDTRRTGSGGRDDAEARPDVQPTLVFEPDLRKTARVALIRRILLWLAIAILVLAVLLVATYRPPPPTVVQPEAGYSARQVESRSAAERAVTEPPVIDSVVDSERDVNPVHQAVQFVNAIDRAGTSAREQWRRADGILPQDVVAHDAAEQTIEVLLAHLPLLDTAAFHLADAVAHGLRMADVARRPGVDVYRFSILAVAVDDYVELLSDEAVGQRLLFYSHLASARAAVAGNEAEAEIKFNVATSHLRKSEKRKRRLDRRAQAVRDALLHLRGQKGCMLTLPQPRIHSNLT